MSDSNTHPADRLAEVRDKIRALSSEAIELRRQLITGEVDPQGVEYTAKVRRQLMLRHAAVNGKGNGVNGVANGRP